MQINIALTDNNPEQAEILRGQWKSWQITSETTTILVRSSGGSH